MTDSQRQRQPRERPSSARTSALARLRVWAVNSVADVRADEPANPIQQPKEVITTTIPHPTERLVYTVAEAAQALRIGRSKLYELLASGEIESIHIGRSRKIPAPALSDYINRQREKEESA